MKQSIIVFLAAFHTVAAAAEPALRDPSMTKPVFEVGARYWYSTGTLRTSLSNPGDWGGSTLDYTDLNASSLETFFRGERSGFVLKGFMGLGMITSGTFRDKDYYRLAGGMITWSDTTSNINAGSATDGSRLVYGALDLGYRGVPFARYPGIRLGGFAGLTYWNEVLDAYGMIANPVDDRAGEAIAAINSHLEQFGGEEVPSFEPGEVAVPFANRLIRNDGLWFGPRIGAEFAIDLGNGLGLSGEAAFLPFLFLKADDSHFFRRPPFPNFLARGAGMGAQLQLVATWRIDESWEVGVGGRYWYASADRDDRAPVPSVHGSDRKDFVNWRYGAFAQASYRF